MAPDFDAFVLTGGKSKRMGRDKALIEIDGVPMARRVANALERAGAAVVHFVGGDLAAIGVDVLIDDHPGAGPFGGVLVAVRNSTAPVVVVSPCDLVDPRPETFVALVTALDNAPDAQAAVPVTHDVWRPLPCAIRSVARAELEAVFERGERAVHRALAALVRIEVDAGQLVDADSPEDLPDRR